MTNVRAGLFAAMCLVERSYKSLDKAAAILSEAGAKTLLDKVQEEHTRLLKLYAVLEKVYVQTGGKP